MFPDRAELAFLLAAAALCPAALSWWHGRALVRALDDPMLPERLLANRRRCGAAIGFALAFILLASPASGLWAFPLLVVTNMAASYPARKALYQETWSLGGYLSFMGRLALGVWGFWMALCLFPFAAREAGSFDWLAAAGLAIVLVAWSARYADVLRFLVRSVPVGDGALLQRFETIARSSGIAMPVFEEVPLRGGAIANALALPSLRRSAVVFTETLLARLDADEAAAICAHEVAHLEHFNPRLLRRLNAVTLTVIGAGAGLAVLPRLAGWESSFFSSVIWLVVVAGVVSWRARDSQRNETAADLRAIALCGDAEALARGLTKIHAFARYPRRLDPHVERAATHPSLSRRLRDIRAAAGTPPASIDGAAEFASADGRTGITFLADRLSWTEGDVATHSLSYGCLSDLRVDTGANRASSLVAVERGGRRWVIPFPSSEVARLQAVLDAVDGRLANPVISPRLLPYPGRLAAGFAALIAVSLGQFAMAAAAVLALLSPSAPLLAGTGMGTLAVAMTALRTMPATSPDVHLGLTLFLGVTGFVLIAMAHARRRDVVPRRAVVGSATLGILAAIATGTLVAGGLDVARLHLSAVALPSAAVFLLAASGALAYLRARPARYAAIPVALLGLIITAAGSPWFLDSFGQDPFLGQTDSISWRTIQGTVRAEFSVPSYVSEVKLSPGRRAVIVSTLSGDEESTMDFHVGRRGARLAVVRAVNLIFAADDRVLGLYDGDVGMEVREFQVDAPSDIAWRQRIPRIANPTFTYDSSSRRWMAVGDDGRGGVVRIGGGRGAGTVDETRWPSQVQDRWPQATSVSGETALVVETAYGASRLQEAGLPLAFLLPGARMESRFETITGNARRAFAVTAFTIHCANTPMDDGRLACTAFDGTRTRLALIDPGTATLTPVAVLPGRFVATTVSADGWLSGWLGSDAVALRPSTREGLRVSRSAGERVTHVAAHDDVVATVSSIGQTSTIRLYGRGDAQP